MNVVPLIIVIIAKFLILCFGAIILLYILAEFSLFLDRHQIPRLIKEGIEIFIQGVKLVYIIKCKVNEITSQIKKDGIKHNGDIIVSQDSLEKFLEKKYKIKLYAARHLIKYLIKQNKLKAKYRLVNTNTTTSIGLSIPNVFKLI